jgi:hypothetical protein
MRLMKRNLRPFAYSLYEGSAEITDSDGNLTGEYQDVYSDPVIIDGDVSAARGEVSIRQFGESLDYTKVILLDDVDTPISETSRLWVDDVDTTKPHDYVVKMVAKSLNFVSIAIKKVDVSNG